MALVLGGGGVRCMAQVGVLLELEDRGIRPDLIVGASIGSVLGGVYAYKNDARFLEDFALKFSHNPVARGLERLLQGDSVSRFSRAKGFVPYLAGSAFLYCNRGVLSPGIAKLAYRDVVGRGVLNSRQFLVQDCRIAFAAVAADVNSGDAAIITSGDMPSALFASSAYPGVCRPVGLDGFCLIDGGAVSPVPVMAAHLLGAKKIIAVDVEPAYRPPRPGGASRLIERATAVRGLRWTRFEKSLADVVIVPEGVRDFSFFEFSRTRDCIAAGHRAFQLSERLILDRLTGGPDNSKLAERRRLQQIYGHKII